MVFISIAFYCLFVLPCPLQAVDKGELYKSRSVMLCSRMFDLTQELINTKMRINSFEHAKAQLKR